LPCLGHQALRCKQEKKKRKNNTKDKHMQAWKNHLRMH
jgi:hypothetical protein